LQAREETLDEIAVEAPESDPLAHLADLVPAYAPRASPHRATAGEPKAAIAKFSGN
jgi:hypothetical protein